MRTLSHILMIGLLVMSLSIVVFAACPNGTCPSSGSRVAACPGTCPAPAPTCPGTCPAPAPKPCPAPCPTTPRPAQSLMDILAANPNMSQTVCALQSTGLDKELQGAGPYTFFAPSNCAWDRLDQCTKNLLAEDPTALRNILLYHIAWGYLRACDLRQLQYLGTLNGSPVMIGVKDGRTIVNGIILRKTDIMACNGVIHTVDSVIVPQNPPVASTCPGARSYMSAIAGSDNFTILESAIKTAGLESLLSTSMPITVLAPTDDAFGKVPKCDLDALMANPVLLRQVLLYHILPGKYMAADLRRMIPVNTFLGVPINPMCVGTAVRINGANVVAPDVLVGNGVVQAIDTVLIPQVPPCGGTSCQPPAPRPCPCPAPACPRPCPTPCPTGTCPNRSSCPTGTCPG